VAVSVMAWSKVPRNGRPGKSGKVATGHHGPEPKALDVEREVLDQPEARPPP